MTLVDVADVFISKDEPPEQVAEHLRTVAASIPKITPPAAEWKNRRHKTC